MKLHSFAALAFALTVAAGTALQARPLVPAEQRIRPFTANLPACDDIEVLNTIADRFRQKESLYWNSALEIRFFDRVGETGFRSNGLDYIPRRYCTAKVILNDQHVHQATYWIGERLGIIGYSWGIEWGISGLDRNNACAPACREARP